VSLSSDSLSELGDYLENSLGPFLVSEYAHNKKVRERVNLFLGRLQDYLCTQEEVDVERPDFPLAKGAPVGNFDDKLQIVEQKLVEGTPWDALAALRRIVEMRLRDLARKRDVKTHDRAGAGSILESLRRTDIIPDGIARSLRYSITVANRAVHGFEVTPDEADEAVRHARLALHELGLTRPSRLADK
jgi:hypothetical protein